MGGIHSTVVGHQKAGQQVKESVLHLGKIHTKFHLFGLCCPWPSIAFTVQNCAIQNVYQREHWIVILSPIKALPVICILLPGMMRDIDTPDGMTSRLPSVTLGLPKIPPGAKGAQPFSYKKDGFSFTLGKFFFSSLFQCLFWVGTIKVDQLIFVQKRIQLDSA